MSNTVTISRKEYEALLRAKAERDRLRAEVQEAEIHAEAAEAEAHADAAQQVKNEQKRTQFWARAWWNAIFFYAKGAWEQVHALSAKLTHREKLLKNQNLEPAERMVLAAETELSVAPKHRDRQGRALMVRKDVMQLSGLSASTVYRAEKNLEAAGHLDAKVYYNQVKKRRDRFVKLAPAVTEAPETLSTRALKIEAEHPRCNACEGDNTLVSRKTIQTITCRECGNVSTRIMPEKTFDNPLYRTTEQDPANPGNIIPVTVTCIINAGPKASGGNSA